MKQCRKCKTILSDETNFCTNCGSTEFEQEAGATTVLNQDELNNFQQQQFNPMGNVPPLNNFTQNNIPPYVNRATVSKSEFMKQYADPALKKAWKEIGIFFYIAGGLSILLSIVMLSPIDIIFALILLGLGLGTHLAINKPCAIILLILSALNTLLCLIFFGTAGGFLWIIVSAMAISKMGKIDTQYKQFTGGMF